MYIIMTEIGVLFDQVSKTAVFTETNNILFWKRARLVYVNYVFDVR